MKYFDVLKSKGVENWIKLALRLVLGMLLCSSAVIAFSQQRPVDLVYPLLDAAHSRWFYFSSACRPFGMVSLFPDNETGGEWESGYRYTSDTIRDFSHIHEWQLSGVAVMPVTIDTMHLSDLFSNYTSAFSHSNESIQPGYHAVYLQRYKTKVELTATNRVGFHRYQFPENEEVGVVFQLSGFLGPSQLSEGGFQQTASNEIRGYVVNAPTMRRPKNAPVYFCARFSEDIQCIYLDQSGRISSGLKQWQGKNGNIIVHLKNSNKKVLMKVALSYTNEEGAARNMDSELSHWDFDSVKADADQQWNNMLGRIQVEGGTEQQQRRLYTDLWHAIQGRRIVSDFDGKYADCTGNEKVIRQLPFDNSGKPKFNMYNSDAFWGAQWTLNTLWQLVYPEIAEEFCNSFLEYYKNGGLIPRGPSGGNYTFVMTGASSTPFFVSAWQKGIRGFDINIAYDGLRKNHMPGGMMSKIGYEHNTNKGGGLEYYMTKGYIPYPLSDTIFGSHQDGAGITLEDAYQDWCLAQLAKSLGKDSDYIYFIKRSENFRNLFNPTLGYIVPKDKSGNWKLPYDPLLYDNGFVEGNGAQLTWFVPHNLQALFQLMEGKDSAVNRLNRQFELSRPYRFCNEHPELINNATKDKNLRFINDKRTWINYSNQPNSHAAFIFNYIGAPWLTQYWSRMVVDSCFSALSPYYGYNGDEDQGLMGSLAVLMKIGIFQMTGGCEENPKYELGSTLFDRVIIHLQPKYYKAKTFIVETRNNNKTSPYIQSVILNGKALKTFYFRHSDINDGAKLIIDMGEKPNLKWGNN